MIFVFACFQEFTQTKAIDWQELVGHVGGYVGLCLGYALLQIPSFLKALFGKCKLAMETRRRRRVGENEPIIQNDIVELQV